MCFERKIMNSKLFMFFVLSVIAAVFLSGAADDMTFLKDVFVVICVTILIMIVPAPWLPDNG